MERTGLTLTKPGCWLSPSRIQPCGHLSTQRRLELCHHLPLLPPVAAELPEPPRAGAGLSCMLAKSLQSSPTLCDPKDYSLPGASVHGRFTRQEYWSGLPCPPPGDLPNLGIEPMFPALQLNSLLSEPAGKPRLASHRPLMFPSFSA